MGLIGLMESDSRWRLTITLDIDSRSWTAKLSFNLVARMTAEVFDDIAAPVYIGIAESMLGAITELDHNILKAQKED